jgi:hypothetical protein
LVGDSQWIDWSFASGQPAYDARIGGVNTFTPATAIKNDAIFFPDIPFGTERRLLELDIVVFPSGTSQVNVEFELYDLVGYYPLIDGDNTDIQEMDNTLLLPRYVTGEGVFPVLVNHVAPSTAVADMVVTYTNSLGVTNKTVTWHCNLNGPGKVSYTHRLGGGGGLLYAALAEGDTGIRAIESVQFVTPPSGLWVIYLVKPLGQFANRAGSATTTTNGTMERNWALQNAFRLPLIPDGAWLGFFYLPNGGGRSITLHGNAKFIWG